MILIVYFIVYDLKFNLKNEMTRVYEIWNLKKKKKKQEETGRPIE